MTEPRRWLEDDRNAPPLARELLQHARPTRAIDKRALSLSAVLIAKLVATPAAAALPLAVKVFVSASLVGVAAIASVQLTVPSAEHGPEKAPRAAQRSAPAARVRPVEREAEARTIEPAAHEPPAAYEAKSSSREAKIPEHEPAPAPELPPRKTDDPLVEPALVSAQNSRAPKHVVSGEQRPAKGSASDVATPAGRQALVPDSHGEAPAGGDALSREVELLDRARTRLDRDPAGALELVEEHAKAFPRALLATEREILAIDALTRLGRTREAAQRAQRVLRHSSHTMYRERLRSILERPSAPETHQDLPGP